jgi:hypothetical protein
MEMLINDSIFHRSLIHSVMPATEKWPSGSSQTTARETSFRYFLDVYLQPPGHSTVFMSKFGAAQTL